MDRRLITIEYFVWSELGGSIVMGIVPPFS
jgi:hypothetical protein